MWNDIRESNFFACFSFCVFYLFKNWFKIIHTLGNSNRRSRSSWCFAFFPIHMFLKIHPLDSRWLLLSLLRDIPRAGLWCTRKLVSVCFFHVHCFVKNILHCKQWGSKVIATAIISSWARAECFLNFWVGMYNDFHSINWSTFRIRWLNLTFHVNQAIFRFAVQSKHFARLEKVVTFYDRLFHRKLFLKLHILD